MNIFKTGINYKTPAAVRAVHNLEVSTKRQVIKFTDIISKSTPELVAKKVYMQSDEFWRDEHNLRMASLYDEMIDNRDKIAESIKQNNANADSFEQVQGINGFARIKSFLRKNSEMNFWNEVSVLNRENYDYKFTQMKIYNLAREFKSKIGL